MEAFIKKNIKIIGGLPYEEIGDVVVGVATTQVDFTGLNIGKDDELLLVSDWYNSSGSTSDLSIFANNNTTATNYYTQWLTATGTSVSSTRYNANYFMETTTTHKGFSKSNIKLTNSGYFVFQATDTMAYSLPTNVLINNWYTTSTFTLTSITSINIKSTVASAIGIGSRFQLYKLVAEKVADITVGTATTSVDITGLNIGKDGEYMLVSEAVYNAGTPAVIGIGFNENLVTTNYYRQYLGVQSTTIYAARQNNFDQFAIFSGTKTFFSTHIKVTNSGYIVYQGAEINYLGIPTSLGIVMCYGTSLFTVSSISSLKLTASVANGIGIGSRFQLYRIR